MRIETFITSLLYEHDCVIVPGFGGLVANYRGARLSKVTHVVKPPSKHVGFNRHLTHNDGLLAGHISKMMSIGYHEAIAHIEEQVAQSLHALNNNERLNWAGIGIFFKDRNGQLQFIPEEQTNFLLESYGLSAIQLHPIAREVAETPVVEMPAPVAKPASNWVWKVAVAAAIPVVALSAWWMIGHKSSGNFSFADLNPLRSYKLESAYAPMEIETASFSLDMNSGLEKLRESKPDMVEVRYNFLTESEDENGLLIKFENAAPAVSTATRTADVKTKTLRFEIIGGAFAVKENAENFLAQLKAKGYPATMAGKRGQLYLVAYGAYETESEARNAMTGIKAQDAHAWLKR